MPAIETYDEAAEIRALVGDDTPSAVVHGFDTAALFLLDLNFINLFEETNHSTGYDVAFRCKGCRREYPRKQRESHWKMHRASRTAGRYDAHKEGKMATAEKKERAPKKEKVTAKSQGFPAEYLADNGNFRVGMDARAKSDLVNTIVGVESKDALHKFTPAEAQKLIDIRGWGSYVEKKREAIANAEKRKTDAAAKKAEAAKTTAATKAAAKKAPAAGGAKPDPKPTGRKKPAGRGLRRVK